MNVDVTQKEADASQSVTDGPKFDLSSSRGFASWLAGQSASLAFTTYHASKVFLLGVKPEGRLSIFERTIERCMGMAVSDDGFWLTSAYQLWHFQNVLGEGETAEGYDRLYLPRMSYVTGDIDVHDVAVGADGAPIFVNTLFSCLSTVSNSASFRPVWIPPFISRLAAEDRCHLNGLALLDGAPACVTGVAQSDVADGWRDHRTDGGFIMDVETNEVIASGLSMPHSPRIHDKQLYVLESGRGRFGSVDPRSGEFTEICFCPGYARGLGFVGNYAVVGLSNPRGDDRTFKDLPLDEELAKRNTQSRCGLLIIDLKSGDIVEWVRVEGIITELYDIAILPEVRLPSLVGFKGEEIRRIVSIE